MTKSRDGSSLFVISAVYILWAALFIHLTSFICFDGNRYYSLFDDAMVSMRYAWNFAHGSGLVWNIGEHVEGYTNPLMTLFMSIPMLILNKKFSVLFVQISGIFFVLFASCLTMRIADNLFSDESNAEKKFLRTIFFTLPMLYYPFSYWSLTGMETGLLSVTILSSLLLVVKYREISEVKPQISLLMGLAYLARPDSIIPVAIIFLFRIFCLKGKENWKRVILIESLILLFIGAAHLVFRFFYYGELVPNTYTLKITGIPFKYRILNGIIFIRPFITTALLPFFIAAAGLVLRFKPEFLLVFTLFASSVFYSIWAGGDAWPYWRMMAPYIPLLLLMIIYYVNTVMEKKSRFFRRSAVILTLLLSVGSLNFKFIPEIIFQERPYSVQWNYRNVNTAVLLSELLTEDASVAVTWAGAIPYYTGMRGVDILGKTDRYVANRPPAINKDPGKGKPFYTPGHNKYDIFYSIATKKPTYVQVLAPYFGLSQQRLPTEEVDRYTFISFPDTGLYKAHGILLRNKAPEIRWENLLQIISDQ